MIARERVHCLHEGRNNSKTNIIYWMSRDQRTRDNWGLSYALELMEKYNGKFAVVFTLAEKFLDASLRQYAFMLEGLKEVEKNLSDKNIPFHLLLGDPAASLKNYILENNIGYIITDFDPLRIKRKWQKEIAGFSGTSLIEVDSHNIVPVRFVSQKQEFGAYTLRPKIKRNLEKFLDEFPELPKLAENQALPRTRVNWEKIYKSLKVDLTVKPVNWIKPGQLAAEGALNLFLDEKLNNYQEKRNDPNEDALSGLSPYLHFGQIGAQSIAMQIIRNLEKSENTESFLEELIVRKELSDNYCHYNSVYDTLENVPEWARKTLDAHRNDERDFLYKESEFEEARTHDPLWNAAQNEMREKGKMHGYMRMYWAKKILEWTPDPDTALQIAIYLNDKYELDGRDPNGYTGCAWAIAGVHDRAWTERPVYGKIRYMNYNGAKRKFNVENYIRIWKG